MAALSLSKLLGNRGGNVALLFALLLPLLCIAGGAGFDGYRRLERQARLQSLADALALRGAREFLLASANAAQIKSLLEAVIETDFPAQNGVGDFTMDVDVDEDLFEVRVSLEQAAGPALVGKAVPALSKPLSADATAIARGGANVCLIALEDRAPGALQATIGATLEAPDCSLLSNSGSNAGVKASGASKFKAALICSAGGYSGNSSAFQPVPVTNCPITEDPLRERDAPTVGLCDHHDFVVGDRDAETSVRGLGGSVGEVADLDLGPPRDQYTLEPGVYCGGLAVGTNAAATLMPGVYVIKDGDLIVDINGSIAGQGVSFHLAGDSKFSFGPDTKIELSAPKEGLLAGVLFYEDRNTRARTHAILSNDARTLLGTFYLPNSTLLVSTLAPVGDRSAYTAIVAREIELRGTPTLVLNTDYSLTDVPVPVGLGPAGGEVYLRD